jgi:putative transposase
MECIPNLIREWKKLLLSELPQVFNSRNGDEQKTLEEERDRLFQQIGQLQYELAWLKKSWRGTLSQKRQAIAIDEPRLSVRRQCDLLGLSRGSWQYRPVGESEENLQLMRLLDEQYTRTPFYGVLRMTAWLQRQGYAVNEKRVRRLLRTMGLMAIYPSPKTSQPAPSHQIYPYLLRGGRDHSTECGLVNGYHLYPAGSWLCLSGSNHGLVQSLCAGLAPVQ